MCVPGEQVSTRLMHNERLSCCFAIFIYMFGEERLYSWIGETFHSEVELLFLQMSKSS